MQFETHGDQELNFEANFFSFSAEMHCSVLIMIILTTQPPDFIIGNVDLSVVKNMIMPCLKKKNSVGKSWYPRYPGY